MLLKRYSSAIVGEPNVGKSTLLNALLNEDRAIVSDIAGTTRDTVEENYWGIGFRFIDTGYKRDQRCCKSIRIQKTFEKIDQSQVVIYLFDSSSAVAELERIQIEIEKIKNKHPLKPLIVLANKVDKLSQEDKNL